VRGAMKRDIPKIVTAVRERAEHAVAAGASPRR
jgi:hypothetical protein